MIQFNLLPDIKLQYVKAQRMKHLVMVISVVVASVMVFLMTVLFIKTQTNKNHLSNLDEDIEKYSNQLKNEADVNKILTVQNQILTLNGVDEVTIDGLHEGKPAVERLGGFLSKVTPNEVDISELKVDLVANTMSFTGGADSIKAVNEFVDTLKFTTFSKEEVETNAFSQVVLTSFARNETGLNITSKKAAYQIDVIFDPGVFDITKNVQLKVPNEITTRSVKERPSPLFQQSEGEGQ